MARDWKVQCDRTSAEIMASDAVQEWTGLIVRWDEMDERHPQEFVRARRDRQNVSDPRPEPPDIFLDTNDVTADSL